MKEKRIGILKGFELFIPHREIIHHVYSNLLSADLCYILKQYKMLEVKIYSNTKHSELSPQKTIFDKLPTFLPEKIFLGSLQESDIEGRDIVISSRTVLKTIKEKRIMMIKCSCNCITRADKNIGSSKIQVYSHTNNCKNNCHGNIGKHGKKDVLHFYLRTRMPYIPSPLQYIMMKVVTMFD